LFSNDKNNSEGRWPTFPVGHPLSEFTETLGHDLPGVAWLKEVERRKELGIDMSMKYTLEFKEQAVVLYLKSSTIYVAVTRKLGCELRSLPA